MTRLVHELNDLTGFIIDKKKYSVGLEINHHLQYITSYSELYALLSCLAKAESDASIKEVSVQGVTYRIDRERLAEQRRLVSKAMFEMRGQANWPLDHCDPLRIFRVLTVGERLIARPVHH